MGGQTCGQAYSPHLAEGEFCELCLTEILGSSPPALCIAPILYSRFLRSRVMWQLRGWGRGELTCSGTPPAVGYLRCSRSRSASPPKRPPNRSATPAASGRRPIPPVGGSTAAPYWAPAAPYWYWAAAAYWSVATPCAIAGAATTSVRRATIVARYRVLFMSSPPSREPLFPIIKISMRGRRSTP